MLVCEDCGSKDVQVLAWVDANTNEYKGEGPNNGSDQNWCEKWHTSALSDSLPIMCNM